jgi:hypothetical protein
MMNEIRSNVTGRIESGEEQGRYVVVKDDRAESGGFLILTAADVNFQVDGADFWVEDEEALTEFFEESRWVVNWLDQG